MKKMLISLVVVAAVNLETQEAKAEAEGFQVEFFNFTSVTPVKPIELSLLVFISPGNDTIYVVYGGPTIPLGQYFWIGPRIGVGTPIYGKPAFVASLWGGLTTKKVDVFANMDTYLQGGDKIPWYLYVTGDHKINERFFWGVQVASLSGETAVGPHAGINLPWKNPFTQVKVEGYGGDYWALRFALVTIFQ